MDAKILEEVRYSNWTRGHRYSEVFKKDIEFFCRVKSWYDNGELTHTFTMTDSIPEDELKALERREENEFKHRIAEARAMTRHFKNEK